MIARSMLSPTRRALALAALAALALAVAPARADMDASTAWVADLSEPGVLAPGVVGAPWLPWAGPSGSLPAAAAVSAADRQAWLAQLQAVAAFLKTAPVLARPPAGLVPELRGSMAVLEREGLARDPRRAPLWGGVSVWAWPQRDVVDGGAKGLHLVPGAHNLSLRLEFNEVLPLRGEAWMKDAQGSFGPLERQGEYAGYPIVRHALMITRDGRSPYRPVAQARALAAFVAGFGKELDELRAAGLSPKGALADAVEDARRRLAAMSPAERKAPAWARFGEGPLPEIVPAGTPGAVALVRPDETFFDPKQPRHALRVVWVRELRGIAEQAVQGHAPAQVYRTLLQQVDWRAFAARFLS